MKDRRLMYIPVAAMLAWLIIGLRGSDEMIRYALETAAGTAAAPFQYRVLSAWLLAGLSSLLPALVALWLYWFVLSGVFAALMHEWMRVWMPADRAQGGVFLTLILSLAFISFLPAGALWSGTEALFWVAALLLLHRERYGWLAPLVVVATLNRETGVFLVLLAFLVTWRWRLAPVLGLTWAVTYGGIRLHYADAINYYTLAKIWHYNTATYRFAYFLVGLPLFGWLPVLAARGYRDAPWMLQRAAWATVPYLAAIAVFGIWREYRLFMPLLVVAIPLVMGARENEQEEHLTGDERSN